MKYNCIFYVTFVEKPPYSSITRLGAHGNILQIKNLHSFFSSGLKFKKKILLLKKFLFITLFQSFLFGRFLLPQTNLKKKKMTT